MRTVARVLAVDIGTSSVRATLYGRSLQPLRQGTHVRYRWRIGSDGSVEAVRMVRAFHEYEPFL